MAKYWEKHKKFNEQIRYLIVIYPKIKNNDIINLLKLFNK